MTNIKHLVAVVTGASRGIGRSLAISLAQRGYQVALVARDSERLADVQAELRTLGAVSIVCSLDLSVPTNWPQLVATVNSQLGRCSCLVHNAARLGREQLDANDAAEIVATNLTAPIALTRLFLADLRSTQGSVVFVASTAGRVAFPYMSLYTATKHGLVGFAESLRFELGDQGIHVMVAYPPMTNTDMTRVMAERAGYTTGWMATSGDVGRRIIDATMDKRQSFVGSWSDRLCIAAHRLSPRLVNCLLHYHLSTFRNMMHEPTETIDLDI